MTTKKLFKFYYQNFIVYLQADFLCFLNQIVVLSDNKKTKKMPKTVPQSDCTVTKPEPTFFRERLHFTKYANPTDKVSHILWKKHLTQTFGMIYLLDIPLLQHDQLA